MGNNKYNILAFNGEFIVVKMGIDLAFTVIKTNDKPF